MRLFRPWFPAGCLYRDALFRIKTTERILFLTFDDGPDPVSTTQLLDLLRKYKIPAIFFCSGSAAEKYPELISLIRADGHLTGNHGYNHLNGWKTSTTTYLEDVKKASSFTSDTIFRPPYGRITIKQRRLLKFYRIIFWDVMPYDFDISFGGEKCLKILKSKIRPGSVIVLHDKVSSCSNSILEEFILFAQKEGYRFGMIQDFF
jgi:peptidoglycan/xylan/chitin deacetylase (PgdA/CDA1 family)